MFIKKYGDICVSAFFGLLSIIMIVASYALPKSKVMDIGPEFMPLVISYLTLGLSALLLVTSLKNLKKTIEKAEASDPDTSDYKRVILSFLAITVYAFVLKTVGFIICTILFLPFEMYTLAPEDKRTTKDKIILVVIGIVFTFAVFFLFRYGFKILLPEGILSGVF